MHSPTNTHAVLPERDPDGHVDVAPILAAIEPVIRAHEAALEQGEIPTELSDALWDTGISRSMLPVELGGLEMHPVDWMDLAYGLTRINGSVGWLAGITTGALGLLEPDVMTELFSEGKRYIPAGGGGRFGQARRVDGGYRITGRWTFASAQPYATHIFAMALVEDEAGEPVLGADGQPQAIVGIVPASEISRVERYDGLGLRGTGSNTIEMDGAFVPDRLVSWSMGEAPLPYRLRPLYREFFTGLGHAAHSLGLAQAAIDAYIDITHRKAARGSARQATYGRHQVDGIAVGKAEALVRAAQLFAWDVAREMYEDAHVHDPIRYELRVRASQVNTYASWAAKEALALIISVAGTDAVIGGSRLEVIQRDMMTVAQHLVVADSTFESIGQYFLTRDLPGGPVIDTETTMITGPHPQDEQG